MKTKYLNWLCMGFLILAMSSAASAVSAPYTIVLNGIDSPRQMAFDSKGNLYIASAGTGGSGTPFALSRSYSLVGPICQGNTAQILKLGTNGKVKTVVGNLPSQASCQEYNPANFGGYEQFHKGTVALGVSGLAVFESGGNTSLYVTVGGSTEVTSEFCLPGGTVVNTDANGLQTTTCKPNFSPSDPNQFVQSLQQLLGNNGVNFYNTVGVVNVDNYSGSGPAYNMLFNQMKYLEDQYNFDSSNTAGLFSYPGWSNKENDIVSVLKVGNTLYAVDAGANVIWNLSLKNGTASVAALMPNVGSYTSGPFAGVECLAAPCAPSPQGTLPANFPLGTDSSGLQQSVPAAIAQNPVTGVIYIGEIGGFNSPNPGQAPGTSRIWKFDPSTTPATLTKVQVSGDLTGFSSIQNIAFAPNGDLFAVQYNNSQFTALPIINGPGSLVRVRFSSPTQATVKVIDDTIPGPTGVAVGNGKIYVGDNQDAGIHQAEIRAYNIPK